MKKNNIVVALILCMTLMFSGCTVNSNGKEQMTASEDSTGKPKEDTIKILTIGYGTDLDPYIPISNNEYILPMCGISNDTLVGYDNGKIVPRLAKSWEINDGGKEIIFHLRKGVTFHDGETFTADTAARCLLYYKDYPMFSWMKGVTSITNAEAVDDVTLKVTYEKGYYATLADMTSSYKLPMISPKMIIEGNYETMNTPIGTGPYIYDTYVKGDYTRFIRNENYWGEQPEFDEIIVKYIPDSGTRLKALQTGEVDMIFSSIFISYDEFKQATSLDGIKGQISEAPVKTRNIVVNASSPLLEDLNVRRAIAMAIDKKSIVEGYTYGYEQVADTLFPSNLDFCDVTMNTHYDYTPDQARDLLEEANWTLQDDNKIRTKDGRKLSLVFTYPSDTILNKEIVSAISANLSDIGIEVLPKGQELMTWYMEGMEGKYDISIGTTNGPPYDPHNYLAPMLDSLIDMVAISGLEDSDEFFEALKKSTMTADRKQVSELYSYMLNYLNDNVVEIPLSFQREMVIYREDVVEEYDFGGLPTELNPFGL